MIAYSCDNCGKTSNTMAGWHMASMQLLYQDPNVPTPPGGRTLQETKPDMIFDKESCRVAWLETHGYPKGVTA